MVWVKNTTKKAFAEYIEKKKVVLICAGKKIEDFLNEYSGVQFDVVCVIDNYKAGTIISIKNSTLKVQAFSQVAEEITNAVLIITSKRYCDAIVKQMDELHLFNNCAVYIPELFEDDFSPFQFVKTMEIVPRKIHYCWFGRGEIPEKFKDNIESWKRFCPDYEITRWDEDNYDVNKCLYMKQAYEAKSFGFVPDYARLDIIYTHGGIYLDVDVEMLRPWDTLLSYPLFCGYENREYVAFGLGFGACKRNAIIKEMMEDYERMEFEKNNGRDKKPVPSPAHQTRILRSHGLLCDGQSKDYGDYLVLAPKYFAPVNIQKGITRPYEDSFSIHQYAGTWLDDDENIKKDSAIRKYSFLMKHMIEDGD